jgi:gamma-glutamylcyclotransferase (GGCT)/AIG2-like uncharacterized protein YtfP
LTAATERLFSYGTLQLPAVQQANFGRLLDGARDVLVGYVLEKLEITDDAVIAESGERFHWIAVATGNEADRVPGMVFEVTAEELVAADVYEAGDYARVAVTLQSGARVWVYVRP